MEFTTLIAEVNRTAFIDNEQYIIVKNYVKVLIFKASGEKHLGLVEPLTINRTFLPPVLI